MRCLLMVDHSLSKAQQGPPRQVSSERGSQQNMQRGHACLPDITFASLSALVVLPDKNYGGTSGGEKQQPSCLWNELPLGLQVLACLHPDNFRTTLMRS